MARPKKQGMDYFPLDVDFFDDEKIVVLGAEHGMIGELVAVRLLCVIYRQGYYMEWSEMARYKLMRSLPGVTAQTIDDIVATMVRWGFFDSRMFAEHGVLTSRGIQRRYFHSVKKRGVDMTSLPYLVVPPTSDSEATEVTPSCGTPDSSDKAEKPVVSSEIVSAAETPVFSAETPQSKVKENKEKNNKENQMREREENAREAKGAASATTAGDTPSPSHGVEEKIQSTDSQDYRATASEEAEAIRRDEAFCASLARLYGITPQSVGEYLAMFEAETCAIEHKSLNDARSHFARWLRCMATRGTLPRKKVVNDADEQRRRREQRAQEYRQEQERAIANRMTADEYLRQRGYAPGTSLADIIRSQLNKE